jgi:hypothetical protein
MKPICAICGRRTEPFVIAGTAVIGPKCAKRAGMPPTKVPKGSRLRFVRAKPSRAVNTPETGDLFEGLE